MIKLSASGSTRKFTSAEFAHTSNDAGTVYTLNHNFGAEPDLIVCQVKINGFWINMIDYWVNISAGQTYAWTTQQSVDNNNSLIRVHRVVYSDTSSQIQVGGGTLRFICFSY